MSDGIIRKQGGTINPDEIRAALLTIPGVDSIDKLEMARVMLSILKSGIDQAIGDRATDYEKACYLIGTSAAMTLLALKELDETEHEPT